MLIKTNALKGYTLKSLDGDMGSASEFYFDDQFWTIRYFVVNPGSWLFGKKVLVSPYSVKGIDSAEEKVSVFLTKKQIEESPSIDTHEPISRHYEDTFNGYYGFPDYWGGPYVWGNYPYIERDSSKWNVVGLKEKGWDRHLRSTQEVTGYHIGAIDGEIGHVDDFIVDDKTWMVRYLVVSTKNWWPGKRVLISPKWIEKVSWEEREVAVGLSRETIKDAPEYTEEVLLTREYESSLYGHYHREGYWGDEVAGL